jgi:diacylglycerol kinase
MKSGKFSFKERFVSFRFALNGVRSLLKYEHNSRIHFIVAILAIILGLILGLNLSEWSILMLVIGIVFITELMNSSIESLADRIDPELNEQIRKAKDYAAAAVLIAAFIAIIAGCFIFIPKLLTLLKLQTVINSMF